MFTSEDDTHGAAVVTMLQDSRGDKNCSLTLTLTLTMCSQELISCTEPQRGQLKAYRHGYETRKRTLRQK